MDTSGIFLEELINAADSTTLASLTEEGSFVGTQQSSESKLPLPASLLQMLFGVCFHIESRLKLTLSSLSKTLVLGTMST